MGWRKLACQGAIEGLLAWTAYWSVESFLLHVLPRLSEPAYLYMPPYAGFTAMLLGLYAAAGAVLGGLAGIALAVFAAGSGTAPEASAFRLRPIVTLTLWLAVVGTVLPRLPLGLPVWYVGVLPALAGLSLLASLVANSWARRYRLAANPWMTAVAGVVLPVIFIRAHPRPTLWAGFFDLLPFLAAALLLAIATSNSLRRAVLANGAVAALLLTACFLLHQEPRRAARLSTSTPSPDKPDVILITMDTVRADHLSLYGYGRDTTPHLRALAGQSTVYTNAISPGDMTLSSHASIFTGLYPSWHGAHFDRDYDLGRPLDTQYPTLAGMLSRQGFDTAAFVANYLYLAPGFGLDRGFAVHDSSAPAVLLGKVYGFLLRERVRNFLVRYEQPWQFDQVFRRAGEINQEALAYLQQERSQGRKFFCFLNYMDAHEPYLPPSGYATRYPGYDPHIDTGQYDQLERDVLTRRRPISAREQAHLISQYDGGIAYMDAALGQLVEQLKQRGLFDNTLLIITSDHGEAFGEKALIGHALSVYQDMVHVPLLIKYPGQKQGTRNDDFVSLTDLLPTTLDLLGYPPPKNIQGRDLLRPPEARDQVISETFVHPLISTWSARFLRSQQALFNGPLKFIRSSTGERELYDLSRDPDEQTNLAASQATDNYAQALVRYLQAAAADRRRRVPAQASSETIEKLKSLGYIQ